MIDVSTPMTFERYTGNWQGCYEGFLTTPKTQMMRIKKTLPGLDGFLGSLGAAHESQSPRGSLRGLEEGGHACVRLD